MSADPQTQAPTDNSNGTLSPGTRALIPPEQNIDVDRYAPHLDEEHMSGLRSLISSHSFTRRSLLTTIIQMRDLRIEAHELHAHVESLTGRLDRVIDDTIMLIRDGDDVVNAISSGAHVARSPASRPSIETRRY